jgi:hypothetical protein
MGGSRGLREDMMMMQPLLRENEALQDPEVDLGTIKEEWVERGGGEG